MSLSRITGDLSKLPAAGFRHHSLWFWGALGFMTIESAGFVLAAASYLYLLNRADQWPLGAPPPDLFWGTALSVLLLLTLIPNAVMCRAARRRDKQASKRWAALLTLLNALALGLRALEFPHLHTRWDHDAYGSIVWALMVLHTLHLITDFIDTAALTAFLWTKPIDDERLSDLDDDGLYWAFVVISWLPIYALIYWAPRWAQ
jgi:cytochrome c oxidase subunit 3